MRSKAFAPLTTSVFHSRPEILAPKDIDPSSRMVTSPGRVHMKQNLRAHSSEGATASTQALKPLARIHDRNSARASSTVRARSPAAETWPVTPGMERSAGVAVSAAWRPKPTRSTARWSSAWIRPVGCNSSSLVKGSPFARYGMNRLARCGCSTVWRSAAGKARRRSGPKRPRASPPDTTVVDRSAALDGQLQRLGRQARCRQHESDRRRCSQRLGSIPAARRARTPRCGCMSMDPT